jgi:PDZ domain-containing protein
VSRRALTLLLGGVLALGLTLVGAVGQVPYVAYYPGPTYDTIGQVGGEPLIEISGRQTFPTDGKLDLTTVDVRQQITLADALAGWFRREVAVVPRELVFPPDKTPEEITQDNVASMAASKDSAVVAALTELSIPVETDVVVTSVADGAPATGKLMAGDVLTSVDDQPVDDGAELRRLITAQPPGSTVEIGYTRDGTAGEVEITTEAAEGETPPRAVIGVLTEERADPPFEIDIALENVGGPSAGLLFALGIIDKLDPASLTGGKYIAGTGTIDVTGKVGAIGGIPQKLLAARRKGAVAFLVPKDNCPEAVANAPDGLALISVATLDDALEGLRALREGRPPVLCGPA